MWNDFEQHDLFVRMSNTTGEKVHKVIWNGVLIAQSSKVIKFAGKLYFSPDSVKVELMEDSTKKSECPFKGIAS